MVAVELQVIGSHEFQYHGKALGNDSKMLSRFKLNRKHIIAQETSISGADAKSKYSSKNA